MSHQETSVAEGAAEHARLLASKAQYLIATAARAPSIHNSQPWRFRVDAGTVELWCDPLRKTRDDALGREMVISCGAALFGLRLAVRSLGYLPVVSLLPDSSRLRLLARVGVGAAAPMNQLEWRMLAAVPHRHTHRGPFVPGQLPPGLLAGLQDDALTEGATLAIVGQGLPLDRLTRLAAAAARTAGLDPGERAEIRRWTRHQGSPAGDGIPAAALAAAPSPKGQPGRLPQRDFDLGRDLGRLPAGGAPPAATAVLLTGGDRRADWLRAGQALQRTLLHAASMWVFASLYSQPLENPLTRELIRDQLRLPGNPQMLLQFGRAQSAASTPRRPPGELMDQSLPDAARAELDADPRPRGTRRLGHGVLPGPLAAAAHDEQVTMPEVVSQRAVIAPAVTGAGARAEQQRARRPQGQDGDHRVLGAAAPDGVAVPGDAVPAVPVQTQPRRQERLAEFPLVVLAQQVTAHREGGVGKLRVLAVEAQQARHIDRAVVHPPPLRSPRHLPGEPGEQFTRPGQPSPLHVHPGAMREAQALRPQGTRCRVIPEVEQRLLNGNTHANTISHVSNTRSSHPGLAVTDNSGSVNSARAISR